MFSSIFMKVKFNFRGTDVSFSSVFMKLESVSVQVS